MWISTSRCCYNCNFICILLHHIIVINFSHRPSGEAFTIPKKSIQSETLPIRGDIVSFTFENYRNAVPFNPKVVRIRRDISWKEVLHDALVHVPKSQSLNGNHPPALFTLLNHVTEKTQKVVATKPKAVSYGKSERHKSARSFFDSIAKAKNLDPLLAESWYSITQKEIKSTKVCATPQHWIQILIYITGRKISIIAVQWQLHQSID